MIGHELEVYDEIKHDNKISKDPKRKTLETFLQQLERHLPFKYEKKYFEELYYMLGNYEQEDYNVAFKNLLRRESKHLIKSGDLYSVLSKARSNRLVNKKVKELNSNPGEEQKFIEFDEESFNKLYDEAKKRSGYNEILNILKSDGVDTDQDNHKKARQIPLYEFYNPLSKEISKVAAYGEHDFELFKLACYFNVYRHPHTIKKEIWALNPIAEKREPEDDKNTAKIEYYLSHQKTGMNDIKGSVVTVGYY